MNLKGAKEFVFEQKEAIIDGGVYKLIFTGVTSSYDEGKKGFIDANTKVMKEWIILKGKVIEEGVKEVKVSKFINYYDFTEEEMRAKGLTDDDIKENNKSLKGISEFYERVMGEEAPDEMDANTLFIALENKIFATKVFIDKMWEVFEPATGKVVASQLKYGESHKMVADMNTNTDEELVDCKEVPKVNTWEGKSFQSYSFSPWVLTEEEYLKQKSEAAGEALEEAPVEETAEPADIPPEVEGGTDWDIKIETSSDDVDDL